MEGEIEDNMEGNLGAMPGYARAQQAAKQISDRENFKSPKKWIQMNCLRKSIQNRGADIVIVSQPKPPGPKVQKRPEWKRHIESINNPGGHFGESLPAKGFRV